MPYIDNILDESPMKKIAQTNGKKTKGRVKIKMEFIDNKLRRYTTFSKRKTGIMKKVSESKFIDNEVDLEMINKRNHLKINDKLRLSLCILHLTGLIEIDCD